MKKLMSFLLISVLFISAFSFSSNNAYAKGISAPTKFTTSSRAYSTSLSWNKVKGVSGYVVYHRTVNSNYKKIKTTTSSSYTHYNLKSSAKHYYRVKSYVKKNGKTSYSPYSKTVIIKTQVATEPEVYTFMTDKIYSNKSTVVLSMKNMSDKSIYIQNYGNLYDQDYADYDRSLTLIQLTSDDNIVYPKSITIKPKKTTYILYQVDDSPTYYDENTTIQFYFYYEGQLFHQFANVSDNYAYIDLEMK